MNDKCQWPRRHTLGAGCRGWTRVLVTGAVAGIVRAVAAWLLGQLH